MTRDQSKFINPHKEKKGNVTIRNDVPAKVIRKCIFSLGNEKTKVEIVSLVQCLNNNLLNINEICDQGQNLTFNSKNYEIRKKISSKLVATIIRTPINVYIFYKMDKEKCFMGYVSIGINTWTISSPWLVHFNLRGFPYDLIWLWRWLALRHTQL